MVATLLKLCHLVDVSCRPWMLPNAIDAVREANQALRDVNDHNVSAICDCNQQREETNRHSVSAICDANWHA